MYVNTFYSFKGGVGRTMALANVAAHLAGRGRRVLVVDFDLEAPGLDTFPALRPVDPLPGLLDYVAAYLETDHAPDVRGFVGECATENVLVMPSGAMDGGYAGSLGRMDWGRLYEERAGYLLFEDLKEQWRTAFAPDYVLIDSRTGFTDTGGICTRQLPDAVTVLFFPNEQNLRGLATVAADIRAEQASPREKEIRLHFVMSNVPDLDDEDDVLIEMKERFQHDLGFEDEPSVVHRYDSLSLLNQAVFAIDRPKSRLAREYGALTDRIVGGNLADPDGARQFVREQRRRFDSFRYSQRDPSGDVERQIERITALHGGDGELLFELGELATRLRLPSAESLLDKAIDDAGYRQPESYLERAAARSDAGDEAGAREDALALLDFDGLPVFEVTEAVRLLGRHTPADIEKVRAITSLGADDQIALVANLAIRGMEGAGEAILLSLTEDGERTPDERSRAAGELALRRIATGRFDDAVELLERWAGPIDTMRIDDAFNYGMAVWGQSGALPKAPFEWVLVQHKTAEGDRRGANYEQCLAFAEWAAGDPARAEEHARRAIGEAKREPTTFSCWRYRYVRRNEFVADTEALLALIGGDAEVMPEFLRRSAA